MQAEKRYASLTIVLNDGEPEELVEEVGFCDPQAASESPHPTTANSARGPNRWRPVIFSVTSTRLPAPL
jgi:hypothetical protein